MDKKIDELERLTRLRDAGSLSAAEFEREKARVLHEPGDIAWFPVAWWFPRRYIKPALTAVAVLSVIGLAAGLAAYRSIGPAPNPPAAPSAPGSEADTADKARPPASAPGADASDPGAPATPCDRGTRREFTRKSQLPADILAALGMDMAEADAPFQVTDAGPVNDLPDRRFVSARQEGCTITVRYEKGGVAHTFETAELTSVRGRWTRSSSER